MFLTPVEIQHQKLRVRLGTYDRAAVDRLLENATASYEHVWLERDELQDRVRELEQELASYRDMEHALRDSLVTAQRTAEDLRKESRREAAGVLRGARAKAQELVGPARAERERLRGEIEHLRQLESELREAHRAFLLAALELLENGRSPTPPSEEAPRPSREREAATSRSTQPLRPPAPGPP